jgi:hypothetical protein
MKRIMLNSILLLSVMVLSLTLPKPEAAENPGATPQQAEAPVYKGGTWTYRSDNKLFSSSRSNLLNGDFEITFQDGKRVISQLDTGGQKVDVGTPGALGLMLPSKGIIEAETKYFDFPLVVGKKWTSKFYSKPASRWLTADNTVTGIETVTTPAGTFPAFRIERYSSVSVGTVYVGTFNTDSTWIYFYSPQTRSLLKYHYQQERREGAGRNPALMETHDIELIKFDAGTPQ